MAGEYYVYILANESQTSLYVGMTNDLRRRMGEHRVGTVEGFTQRYRINRLVYCELYSDVRDAIGREKQLKRWRRDKKVALAKMVNPTWRDLSREDD